MIEECEVISCEKCGEEFHDYDDIAIDDDEKLLCAKCSWQDHPSQLYFEFMYNQRHGSP